MEHSLFVGFSFLLWYYICFFFFWMPYLGLVNYSYTFKCPKWAFVYIWQIQLYFFREGHQHLLKHVQKTPLSFWTSFWYLITNVHMIVIEKIMLMMRLTHFKLTVNSMFLSPTCSFSSLLLFSPAIVSFHNILNRLLLCLSLIGVGGSCSVLRVNGITCC